MYLHGGDYNPEQWIGDMDLVKSDIRKLKEANINTVTLGMFSWSTLEPTEGAFNFKWLEDVFQIIKDNDMQVIMGTPTAARPHWLAKKYPETSRVNQYCQRELGGFRHNHCMQSEVFREKSKLIITKLIDVVSKYDIIHSWHINNEFGGNCFCDKCISKFRSTLECKYGSIESLNDAWWNTFWSHNYSSFDEILPPFAHGENSNTALNINWEKFKTLNHMDYYKFEYDIIRQSSNLPISTNFHGDPFNFSLDYNEFSKVVDYISYDIYPPWNTKDNYEIAIKAKKELILQQSLDISKDFYMMESTPGSTNWQDYTMLKNDKLHYASTFLQLLCSSKSFLYFQLKQSRGSSEKYHGAVLNVTSDTKSRVYNYVKEFGKQLKELSIFKDAVLKREVAIYYDWNNTSMLHFSEGPRNIGLGISEFHDKLFDYFNNIGINVDYVFDAKKLDKYHTILFPFAYNIKPEVIKYLQQATNKKIIAFPLLNYVNADDLLHTGALPNGLTDQFGIEVEEFSAVLEDQTIKSEKYEFECITEVVKTTKAISCEKFVHDVLEAAVTENEYNDSKYIYVAGIPTSDSLIRLLDEIIGSKYSYGSKLIKSNIILNNQEYQMIIQYGEEPIQISQIYWTNGMNSNTLSQYDFAIVKK